MLDGIIPAVFTPMDEHGEVVPSALDRLIQWLIAEGVHGLYVCGSTGEGLLLTEEERQLVAETAVESAAGRIPVIVHVGAVSTDQAVRLARHAEAIGARAISAVPPFAFGKSIAGIKAHYQEIGLATDLPLYLYNIPSLLSVDMGADTVRQLLDVPNVRGIKYSGYDLFEEFRLISLSTGSNRFDVFHGTDELLLYGLMQGAVGGIGMTYNFLPSLYVELYAEYRKGNYARALDLQRQASRFVDRFLRHSHGNMVGLGKVLLGWMGFSFGEARLPNPPISQAHLEEYRQIALEDGLLDRHRTLAGL